MQQYAAEDLVFFDESIFNEKTGWRYRAYRPVGQDIRYPTDIQRGRTWSICATMTVNGWLPCTRIKEGYFKTPNLLNWLRSMLLLALRRESNRPRVVYKTDATFNTNVLKLLLSVLVGINNCRKTFLSAYCYITSESAASFKFVANQLSDLAFYNCPQNAVIIGDFSKGLKAACAAKAAVNLSLTEIINEALVCPPERDKEMLEAVKVIISKDSRKPQHVLLRLFK